MGFSLAAVKVGVSRNTTGSVLYLWFLADENFQKGHRTTSKGELLLLGVIALL